MVPVQGKQILSLWSTNITRLTDLYDFENDISKSDSCDGGSPAVNSAQAVEELNVIVEQIELLAV
jgi:hypothetical protein